jgi:hypothetical protein
MKQLLTMTGMGLTMATIAFCADAPKPAGYVPGLGEFMSSVQFHHAKLWFAGAERNWPLADFELDEIKEALEDAARFHPTHKNYPVGEMIRENLDPAFAALAKAIEGKDAAGFRRAFDVMTAGCNTCHAGTEHEFIRIQRPTSPALTNQIYAPVRK